MVSISVVDGMQVQARVSEQLYWSEWAAKQEIYLLSVQRWKARVQVQV